ncbi:CdaR family protein [Salirhabdus sp. Marseille-P4669]|uniref:CdaR family protein n=1 Tax=Salirhabdus sp. Marseille-P4669 TaxID=2042310 RepID=UPI000C7A706D|nr:CdaR family protein [Salirhabdus sp. Marseille-P4669]
MDKWLKTPWFIRVISLLLAIALYLSVSISQDGEDRPELDFFSNFSDEAATIEDVPLQVKVDEEKYVVLGVPQTVNVLIEGSKSLVATTETTRNFDLFIDLTELEAGTHEVNVQYQGLSNQLKVQIDPATIAVTIEERGTAEYSVEIEMLNQDSLNEEFRLGTPVIAPEKVQVTGSTSEVEKIAIVKAIVDLAGVTDKIEIKNAPVKVYDQQGNELNVFVNPSTVNVEIPIEVGMKEVPISYTTTGELPEGMSLQSISLEAEKVAVYGQASVLNAIEKIEDLEINLSQITEDQTIEVNIPLPQGATKVEPSTLEVKIDVEETQEKVFEDVPIEVLNLASNKEITFVDPEEGVVNVSIFGTAKQLESFTADDISASIDVNGFIEGEFQTAINIKGPENYIITSNKENARVRIE